MQGKPAETRRQTHTCRSGFLDWRRSQRTDDWRANLHPFRIGEFFENGFKPRIRFTNAVGILNNRFAVGKETRNGKGHRDAMIAEAHYARPMQGSRTMNFEAIFHFGDLRDRKSTRLNSSHTVISYAVFCLKKKKNKTNQN